MQNPTPPALAVRHLSKKFKVGHGRGAHFVHAVNDVSFDIAPQHIVALVGESGSGKSTVARLIAYLTIRDQGSIQLYGREVPLKMRGQELRKYRQDLQIIFQDPFAALNPFYPLRYPLKRAVQRLLPDLNRHQQEERLTDALSAVGLIPATQFLSRYPHELSGGQRQRAVIARAIVVEPRLILADEPTSMLDVSIRMGILNLMDRLRQERHVSYLFITHDLASARIIADEIIVMYAGRIVERGSADEVLTHPSHPYTEVLISAVPDPRRRPALQVLSIPGEPPNLAHLPRGCSFYERCPIAGPVCKETPPVLESVGTNHWAACHEASSGHRASDSRMVHPKGE